jgi:hypothetical protein
MNPQRRRRDVKHELRVRHLWHQDRLEDSEQIRRRQHVCLCGLWVSMTSQHGLVSHILKDDSFDEMLGQQRDVLVLFLVYEVMGNIGPGPGLRTDPPTRSL